MFKCEQCSSTFTRKGNLRVHEKKHNGIRFACTICPSTFGYKTNLKKHIKNIHGMINVPKPISAPRDVVDFCSDDDEICMKAMDDFEKNHDLTDNITSFEGLNKIDTFHPSETKSLHSLTDVENINSINLDNLSKNIETIEQNVTIFDDVIKMSNINDKKEFKVVKPVSLIDHNENSEEICFKDISVTVDVTNTIENVEKNEVMQIKHDHSDMSSQNKNEEILCNVCQTFFDVCFYNQHIQTTEHLTACEEYFKDRIDFENYRIFSCSISVTIEEFFKSIKLDFAILVNHLLLKHNALVIDICFFALFHEDSLNVENKNIAEVKYFNAYNKKLTKNTDVYELYEDIVNSFSFQSDALRTSENSWTLEETLYVEITIVKKLFENEIASKSLSETSHNSKMNDNHINTDNLQKTEPLQLIRCKQCCVYVIQKNYEYHLETTAHKISLSYLKNERIQINGVQCDNQFLSCRILSPEHMSIDHFFQSIESDVLELIAKVIKFQNNMPINVNVKIFGLYNHKSLMNKIDNLGDVKSFLLKNENLSEVTILQLWFQQISDKLKSRHENYLKSMPQSYYLARVMFLDLYFHEISNL
uniref:Zinc finger protein 236 n=1 Tax=Melanaphis sacchari TaxID=742174 RepID=A0A2H8TSY1_9HEMI